MKIIAFNGSPRKNGNTYSSIKTTLNEIESRKIDTEIIQIGGTNLFGCLACGMCVKNKDKKCVRTDDNMNEYIEKMITADGIIIGSPTYFSNVTTEIKALIDRCGYVTRVNGGLLKGKVGAPIISARRAGGNFVYSAINFFFGICEMIIPNSNYWNITISRDIGDFEKDTEGVETFKTLGKNIAETTIKLNS